MEERLHTLPKLSIHIRSTLTVPAQRAAQYPVPFTVRVDQLKSCNAISSNLRLTEIPGFQPDSAYGEFKSV